MLKLKDASYPDPERLALVDPYAEEVTYDLGKDGSKWAHGYVPLNPAAVALKHHKQPGGDSGGSTAKGLASRDSGSASARADTEDIRSARSASDSELERRSRLGDTATRRKAAKVEIARRAATKPTAAKSGKVKLERTLPNGQVKSHPDAMSHREAAQAAAYSLHDNGAATKSEANKFAAKVEDAKVGETVEHPSGYKFRKVSAVEDKVPVYNVQTGKTVQDHVKLAIGHNEAAKRALDRGDKATAERHVAKSREHNTAAISAGNAVLGKNAIDRQTLEGHAAALAVPIKDRTADQQKAADDALAYAKELRAKRLAAKKAAPPKVKGTGSALPTKAGRSDRAASGTHSIGGVKLNSDVNSNRSHVGQQSPSADRIGAEAARLSANARANEAARQSPARDALMAKRSAIRSEMATLPASSARRKALARQLTTVNRKLAP